MATYIKPWADIFIRYLFGRQANEKLLLSFTNAVLEDSGIPTIVALEIKNPFNLAEELLTKESILDIKATDENGTIYDIEVQTGGDPFYRNRSLYYWAKNYGGQLDRGDEYAELKPVICINILNFVLIKELPAMHTCFMLLEKDNPDYVLTRHCMLHFLELPKMNKKKNFSNNLERWLTFLKSEGQEEETMKVIINDDAIFAKAHEEYKTFTQDDRMRELYEAREKALKDRNTLLRIAEERGIEKGIEQGIEKGIEKGIRENARRMLEDGVPMNTIAKYTGLSIPEIEALRNAAD
ncbi:MAG TPA: Rpn family recombination-promoting nuclease/putative transposase [Spirochaetota bacterium]|nr:Rpn family recombination-promoting nuclease/putative transposase [Spirochaetota bacterium]